MSTLDFIASGSFTSDGNRKDIALRSDFDFFETENHTQMATTQATGRAVKCEWRQGYADDTAFRTGKENASNILNGTVVTSGGFTRRNTYLQTPEAEKTMAATFVTQANPAVVTVNAHGYSNGDRVRVYSTTSMLQIASMDFTVGGVTTNTFTLAYLDSSGFASAATAGKVRRLAALRPFVPSRNFITGMTAAASMVVKLAVTHNLAVNDMVRLIVPVGWGMIQADGLIGKVTAVDTTLNTVTLNINSSTFTAFAFPTSAVAAGGITQAQLVPFGDVANGVDQAVRNQGQILMSLAGGAQSPAGSSGDVIYWRAMKSAFTSTT